MWAGTEKRAPLGGRTKKLDLKEADDVKQELPTRNSEDPYLLDNTITGGWLFELI